MMYIRIASSKPFTWKVNQPFPVPHEKIKFVTEIQADSDELSTVLNKCVGIPRTKEPLVLRWFGDHAKFIAGVLHSEYGGI